MPPIDRGQIKKKSRGGKHDAFSLENIKCGLHVIGDSVLERICWNPVRALDENGSAIDSKVETQTW